MAHRIKPVFSTIQPWHGLRFSQPPTRPCRVCKQPTTTITCDRCVFDYAFSQLVTPVNMNTFLGMNRRQREMVKLADRARVMSFDVTPVRPADTNTFGNALRVERLDTGEVLGIISDRYVPVPIEHVERVAAMQADERETERSAFVCSCCRIAEPLVDSYCEPCYEGECDRPLGGTCAEARLAAEVAFTNDSYERRFGGLR